MSKLIDLTGKTVGKLLVIKRAENKGKHTAWICECECGNKTIVQTNHLREKSIVSCGCHKNNLARENHLKHGHNKRGLRSGAYSTWAHIKGRCCNPNDQDYKDYGGRGIKVCSKWLDKENGFINFYNDVSKLPHFGEKGYTLNRIDNDGNYELSNVEWADDITQANNRRNNHLETYKGKTQSISMWAMEYSIPYNKLFLRLKNGWSIEKALNTP